MTWNVGMVFAVDPKRTVICTNWAGPGIGAIGDSVTLPHHVSTPKTTCVGLRHMVETT